MPNNTNANDGSKGFAITSMVCGIVALVFCWTFWLSAICAIVALIFGIIALVKKKAGKGMAVAGVVTSSIAIAIAAAIFIFAMTVFNAAVTTIDKIDTSDWHQLIEELDELDY